MLNFVISNLNTNFNMLNYFIIPGLGGSPSNHWQTYFEMTQKNFQRIIQKDWDLPNIEEWIEKIDTEISEYDPETLVLVAHSLGCLTVAEWAKRYKRKIKGALLVAPPDAEVLHQKLGKKLFKEIPIDKIEFNTILVASTTDQYSSLEKSKLYAEKWGSVFINIGDAGHINHLSGFGKWDQGLKILRMISEPKILNK